MRDIRAVIDELCFMILFNEVEITSKQEKFDRLQQKIEMIEQYITVCGTVNTCSNTDI